MTERIVGADELSRQYKEIANIEKAAACVDDGTFKTMHLDVKVGGENHVYVEFATDEGRAAVSKAMEIERRSRMAFIGVRESYNTVK